MSQSVESLEAEAMKLSVEDRLLLAERLMASVGPDPEIEAAWAAEIERRIGEIERGEVELLPSEEVIARLRAEFK